MNRIRLPLNRSRRFSITPDAAPESPHSILPEARGAADIRSNAEDHTRTLAGLTGRPTERFQLRSKTGGP